MTEQTPYWVKVHNSSKYHVFRQVKNTSGEPLQWNPYRSLCTQVWLTKPQDSSQNTPDRYCCTTCRKVLVNLIKSRNKIYDVRGEKN